MHVGERKKTGIRYYDFRSFLGFLSGIELEFGISAHGFHEPGCASVRCPRFQSVELHSIDW